jgi:PadR family transcriptional regulator, regulatory protein PadR
MPRMVLGDTRTTELSRGAIEHCVLALLRSRESYAFDLVRQLAASGLVTSEGTLYPLLSRLRRKGLVATIWRESTEGPPRRYYRITAKGHSALEAFTRQWIQFRDAVDGLIGEARTEATT